MTAAADADALRATLVEDDLRLEPLVEAHREPLRAACAADPDIWAIYPISMAGDAFDGNFDNLAADPGRRMKAVVLGGMVVGMTAFINIVAVHRIAEIGVTYLVPSVRGTRINRRMKALMIDHALGCGFDRIEFRVDVRNARSQAAVAKLGATREGVLRRDRICWNGHVRDTVVFSILRDEWPA